MCLISFQMKNIPAFAGLSEGGCQAKSQRVITVVKASLNFPIQSVGEETAGMRASVVHNVQNLGG